MKSARALLAGALAASGTAVVLGCAPAWACTCQAQSERAYFEQATHVFTGVPVARRDAGASVVWTIRVDGEQKGDVPASQDVTVRRSSVEQCGFALAEGTRYQVFAFTEGSLLRTGQCSGTRALAAGATPYRPRPGESTPSARPSPPASTPPAGPTGQPTAQPSTEPAQRPAADPVAAERDGVPWWPFAAGAVAVAVVAVAARRRRSP